MKGPRVLICWSCHTRIYILVANDVVREIFLTTYALGLLLTHKSMPQTPVRALTNHSRYYTTPAFASLLNYCHCWRRPLSLRRE